MSSGRWLSLLGMSWCRPPKEKKKKNLKTKSLPSRPHSHSPSILFSLINPPISLKNLQDHLHLPTSSSALHISFFPLPFIFSVISTTSCLSHHSSPIPLPSSTPIFLILIFLVSRFQLEVSLSYHGAFDGAQLING